MNTSSQKRAFLLALDTFLHAPQNIVAAGFKKNQLFITVKREPIARDRAELCPTITAYLEVKDENLFLHLNELLAQLVRKCVWPRRPHIIELIGEFKALILPICGRRT